MYRLTKNENYYQKYRKGEKSCFFCDPDPKVVILKSKSFYISKNNFPYDFWDGQRVRKHLLLVSKNHSAELNSESLKEISEYTKLLNKFSKKGFDIFTRTANSPSRTQPHFHTHLINASGKKIKALKVKFTPYSLDLNE